MLKNMKRGLNSNGIRNRISELRDINDKISIKSLFPYDLPGHYSEKGYQYIIEKIYQKTN